MSEQEFPTELVERVARAIREAWRDQCENRDETVEWEDIDEDEREMCMAEALAALRALRDAGALVGPDQVAVPRENLRRLARTAEMSAGIMRDTRRTAGWEGAERAARQFDRMGEAARRLLAAAPRAGGGDE